MDLKEELKKYVPYNEQEEVDKLVMIDALENEKNVFTRDNKLCHFTASSWIVNTDRTKVLMIYHNIYKSWAWTGGHADGDEDLRYVAEKEIKEETGLNELKLLSDGIFSIEVLTVDGHIKKGKYVSSHLHLDCCFLFEADEKDELFIKQDENSGVSWIPIEDAINITNEEKMKPIYQKLNEKLESIF